MDFIERLFRITPDGGSGAYELFLTLAPFLLLTARELTTYQARRRQQRSLYGLEGRQDHLPDLRREEAQ
jgi:hypothetical protein